MREEFVREYITPLTPAQIPGFHPQIQYSQALEGENLQISINNKYLQPYSNISRNI